MSVNLTNDTVDRFIDHDDLRVIAFSWYDYTLFTAMLAMSALIGVYFGCFGNKQSTADEYLLGGKDMNVFPIAMSLVASYVSGITLLAVPVDVYHYGIAYGMSLFGIIALCAVSYYVYLPVFHQLGTRSIYEYLRLRFDDRIRLIASALFVLAAVLYLPIVIYIPALAFSEATGISVHVITPIICAVCIFYTTLGGLKAVVYTDTLQIIAMIGGIGVVLYVGLAKTGGLMNVIRVAADNGRLDLDFDVTLYKRDTFWAAVVGLTFNWLGIGASQGYVQKFIALSSMAKVKRALIMFGVGLIAINTTSLLIGFIMYAHYKDCDPLTSGTIAKEDQLLPYFVMDVAGHLKGISGLFIAGIVCAGLSTLSAVMNCLSCTIYEDFLARFMSKEIDEKRVSNVLKLIVILVGVACTSMVYLIEHMGGLLTLVMSFGGVTTGPKLGLFTLGILVPSANTKGALYGCLTSIAVMSWIVFGTQWYKYMGFVTVARKPLTSAGCNGTVQFESNATIGENAIPYEPLFVYRISYYYYALIGMAVLLVVAVAVSYFTKEEKHHVDPDLLHPYFRRTTVRKTTAEDYVTIEKALKVFSKTEDVDGDRKDVRQL